MALEENHRKTCPFLTTACVQDKCALWATIQIGQIGPLGIAKGVPTQMCVFAAQLMVQGSPKPLTQPMPMPFPKG